MTQLLAYHNDPDIKSKYLERVRRHRAADELIQGTGWSDGKGCAVGCTLEAYDHSRYPIELGIPIALAHLEDRIFEGLPLELSMSWPERFLLAIRPGADLARVSDRFLFWLFDIELARYQSASCAAVTELYRRRLANNEPSYDEWAACQRRAYAAADDAAYAAFYAASYAARAAYAASCAASCAASYASYAASYAAFYASSYASYAAYAAYARGSYAVATARSNSFERMDAKLIELLETA